MLISLLIWLLLTISISCTAFATTYYMAVEGSDWNRGTRSAPWGTFKRAAKRLAPGDTLVIKDGTYHQGLSITFSGTRESPITIKAENDGKVIVDADNAGYGLRIFGQSYVNVEGIIFRNANNDVVSVNNSSYVNLRKLSAYNAGNGNYHLFDIYNGSHDVLVEDCVASQLDSGHGRYCYIAFSGAHDVTFRRNYCKYVSHTAGGGPCSAFSAYAARDILFENNIGDFQDYTLTSCLPYMTNISAQYSETSNNRFFGNILFARGRGKSRQRFPESLIPWGDDHSGWHNLKAVAIGVNFKADANVFKNNVYIGAKSGLHQVGNLTTNTDFSNNTLADLSSTETAIGVYGGGSLVATNNSVIVSTSGLKNYKSTYKHSYNNLYGIKGKCYAGTTEGTGDKCNSRNPFYDTATYGYGAYLMVPTALKKQGMNGADIGATVLYRYGNGVLSSTALWPWPNEERIYREMGVSVTWEANGGLWKTLDGVYPAEQKP